MCYSYQKYLNKQNKILLNKLNELCQTSFKLLIHWEGGWVAHHLLKFVYNTNFQGYIFCLKIMLGTSLLKNVINTYHVVENFFFQESVFYIFIQSSSTHADYYSLKRNSLDPPTLAV